MSGLLGIMMELFNIFPNLLTAVADMIGDIARGSDEADDDDEDDADAEGSTNTKFFIEPTDEDVTNDAAEDEEEDMEDEAESGAGLFDPILNILASIFPPTRDADIDADEEGSGSGDGEEEEQEDNDIHIGVDVEPGSLLDMIINLIPGDEERDEMEDTTEMGEEGTTMSPQEENMGGETTFGGISVSLAPIDLANIFVQVHFNTSRCSIFHPPRDPTNTIPIPIIA